MEKFFNAIRTNDIETLELLIKLGQDVNAKNESERSPLHVAIFNKKMDIARMRRRKCKG